MKYLAPKYWDPLCYQGSPLFSPLIPVLQQFAGNADWPEVSDYNKQISTPITTCSNRPIHFINKTVTEYEHHIHQCGEIPSRHANWHDFFNMAVWLTFPNSKAIINQQHVLARKLRQQTHRRTSIENALTSFDENGMIILCAQPEFAQMIYQHQWIDLFWRQRQPLVKTMRFVIFGHSLFEKALKPYIGMTAKCIILTVTRDELDMSLAMLDQRLATHLSQSQHIQSPKLFPPLPVLGIPGWWPQNDTLEFYQNTDYFR